MTNFIHSELWHYSCQMFFLQLFSKRASSDVDKMCHFLPLQLFHCVLLGAECSLWRWKPNVNESLQKVNSGWDDNEEETRKGSRGKSGDFCHGFSKILHIDVAALLSAHLDNVYANLMKEVEGSEDEDESRVRKVQLKYLCLWKRACLSSHLIH